jgi:uncharacterized membrane protein
MSDLLVLAYDKEETAGQAADVLKDLEKGQLAGLQDVVVVVHRADGKTETKQLKRFAGEKALGGTFWGFLIGIIFFVPIIGAIVGAVAGTMWAFMRDTGIPDDFIKEVKETVLPGTSALFLLVSSDPGQIVERLQEFHGKLIKTTLSDADVDKLKMMHGVE